jgi:hypothetical protein
MALFYTRDGSDGQRVREHGRCAGTGPVLRIFDDDMRRPLEAALLRVDPHVVHIP